MRPSKFYQRWLQVTSRGSTACLFFSAYLLGREEFVIALVLLAFQLISGYVISELMYGRLQAVVKEGNIGGMNVQSD